MSTVTAPVRKTRAVVKKAGDVPTTPAVELAPPSSVVLPESTPAPESTPVKKATGSRKSKVATPTPASSEEQQSPPVSAVSDVPVETAPSSDPSLSSSTPAGPVKRKTQITREDIESENEKIEAHFKQLLLTVKEKKIQGITKLIESLKKLSNQAGTHSLRAIDLAKKTPRRKNPNPNGAPKKPSGLDKPVKISAEYARFINMPANSEMTRAEAIHKLYYDYIKPRPEILVPGKGRDLNIDVDAQLKSLFGDRAGKKVNFITMRQFLKHHFTPVEETATTVGA